MSPKIKNIIIGVVAVAILALIYIFFVKKESAKPSLISSSGAPALATENVSASNGTSEINKDFVSILLSVKSIKLDDAILKDSAFLSLRDSSIILVQTGDEGRPNPFAPIGSEAITPPLIPNQGTDKIPPLVGNTEGNSGMPLGPSAN